MCILKSLMQWTPLSKTPIGQGVLLWCFLKILPPKDCKLVEPASIESSQHCPVATQKFLSSLKVLVGSSSDRFLNFIINPLKFPFFSLHSLLSKMPPIFSAILVPLALLCWQLFTKNIYCLVLSATSNPPPALDIYTRALHHCVFQISMKLPSFVLRKSTLKYTT